MQNVEKEGVSGKAGPFCFDLFLSSGSLKLVGVMVATILVLKMLIITLLALLAAGCDRIRLACYTCTALTEPFYLMLLYVLHCNSSYTSIVAICNRPYAIIVGPLQ